MIYHNFFKLLRALRRSTENIDNFQMHLLDFLEIIERLLCNVA